MTFIIKSLFPVNFVSGMSSHNQYLWIYIDCWICLATLDNILPSYIYVLQFAVGSNWPFILYKCKCFPLSTASLTYFTFHVVYVRYLFASLELDCFIRQVDLVLWVTIMFNTLWYKFHSPTRQITYFFLHFMSHLLITLRKPNGKNKIYAII